jgi:hypothetical protein
MDRLMLASPVPARVSAEPGGGRHAKPRYAVEHIASDFCLGLVIAQGSGLNLPADNGPYRNIAALARIRRSYPEQRYHDTRRVSP